MIKDSGKTLLGRPLREEEIGQPLFEEEGEEEDIRRGFRPRRPRDVTIRSCSAWRSSASHEKNVKIGSLTDQRKSEEIRWVEESSMRMPTP